VICPWPRGSWWLGQDVHPAGALVPASSQGADPPTIHIPTQTTNASHTRKMAKLVSHVLRTDCVPEVHM